MNSLKLMSLLREASDGSEYVSKKAGQEDDENYQTADKKIVSLHRKNRKTETEYGFADVDKDPNSKAKRGPFSSGGHKTHEPLDSKHPKGGHGGSVKRHNDNTDGDKKIPKLKVKESTTFGVLKRALLSK